MKVSFRKEGDVKIPDEGKLKDVISRPTLIDWLKIHSFKQKGNDKKKESWSFRKQERKIKHQNMITYTRMSFSS